jgi:hypothetical protein
MPVREGNELFQLAFWWTMPTRVLSTQRTQKPSFKMPTPVPCTRSMSRWSVGNLCNTLLSSPFTKLGTLSTSFPYRIKTKLLSQVWKGLTIVSQSTFWALCKGKCSETAVTRYRVCTTLPLCRCLNLGKLIGSLEKISMLPISLRFLWGLLCFGQGLTI